ncbi:biogenesis of lysosome-related organelles complex 1 subunit 5-like [Teleopsis dalmanni]|nr:biogenesis of lysosome-related organelles complex 1 subunit 5-like [Teleopsis dalmanni]
MLNQKIGKSFYNAQHRILDHRVFVNGEIENFLNNFEIKRNDIEVETLFKLTETVGELKYDLSDRCISLGTANLNQISTDIKDLLSGVELFLKSTNIEKPPGDFLAESRKQRQQIKDNFCNDLKHGFTRIDNSFEQKEEEIAELYSDLQLKLNITK